MRSTHGQSPDLSKDDIEVRELRTDDLDWVVAIDREHSGESRVEYYRLKLRESQSDTGIRISLAAIVEGVPAGFIMGRLYYGEFGSPEQSAILDSIGIAKKFAGKGVGTALLRQLEMNLSGLRIEKIETQVSWDQFDLLAFFQHEGFRPSARIGLELLLAGRRRD